MVKSTQSMEWIRVSSRIEFQVTHSSLVLLVSQQFGHKCWISNVCFGFFQLGLLKTKTTNIWCSIFKNRLPLGWHIPSKTDSNYLLTANNVWVSKFRTSIVCVISHSSESIWVIKPSFCQNYPPMGGSFWQKDSLITHTLFELCLFRNLAQRTLFLLTL